jgi:hypothetical protein
MAEFNLRITIEYFRIKSYHINSFFLHLSNETASAYIFSQPRLEIDWID